MNTISRTLALLKPADLFPAWKWIDMMEECGEIEADETRRWKEGIYGLMVLWKLEPDEVSGPQPKNPTRIGGVPEQRQSQGELRVDRQGVEF